MTDTTFLSAAMVGPLFVAPSPVDLIITEKLVIGSGPPVVTDGNGNAVFKIKGTFLSSRRRIFDNANRTVVSILPKRSLHSRCHIFRGDSCYMRDLVCIVKQMSYFNDKILGVFLPANTTEEVPDFIIKRSWRDRSCPVYLANSNTIVAQMRKEQGIFKNTNYVRVCP